MGDIVAHLSILKLIILLLHMKKIYDLHQDLMTHIRFRDVLGQSHQTSFEDILSSEVDLVIATAFPFPPHDDQYHTAVPELITEELGLYHEYITQHPDWKLVQSAKDLACDAQKIILHLEGLNVFDGSDQAWDQLDVWVKMGVRSIGTHWNVANQLGGGTLQPDVSLTDLGRELITYLEKQQLIFDLAHMGRKSFADAAAISKRPLYVSHGNTDAVCSNVRNYTDEQLYQIAASDGVIGVFFANTFVVGKGAVSNVEHVVAHIEYTKHLIGVRHIAIGSDLGGVITGGVLGLEEVTNIKNLIAALAEHGYTETEIEAIAWKNADRVLRAHLQ